MSSHQMTTADVSLPDDLESPRAKLLYLYLSACGGATADDVCESLEMDKGSALSIAGTLRDRGYVRRQDGSYELA